jgi:hypothetical protein
MILPALERGGYAFQKQAKIGTRLGGGIHKVDVVAEKQQRRILISLKWQQVGGTAEQKVPFEVMCLAEAVMRSGFDAAYVVLGGEGWTLRDFYTGGGLKEHLIHADKVNIMKMESFIALANQGRL